MYLVVLKTAITEALRSVFDVEYPNPDFRSPVISIEYPVAQTSYPGLWVQYEDSDELSIAGIGHVEYQLEETSGAYAEVTRWKFKGTVTVTCVALTSMERDRLYDELVRTFAFGRFSQPLSTFREMIENNDLVAMNANFDDLRPFGDSAAPGTPWGTDEIIYEKSLSFDVIGEFVGEPDAPSLVPLSKVTVMDYMEGTTAPAFPDEPGSTTVPPTPGDWDRTQWT